MARNAIDRPVISCEVTPRMVFAARSTRAGAVDIVHSRSLPEGAVTPSLTGTNIVDAAAVRDAISECVAAVAGKPTELTGVIPDAASRVVLLDFENLSARYDEAEPVVRFRLKKSLPFDVDRAAVSYDAVRLATGITKVVSAIVLRTVLEEYEQAFRDAGCTPSVVIPSTLAALGVIEADRPTMLLKVDSGTTSVAIVDNDQLLLFRTLDSGGGVSPERLAEDVYPSIVYLQDTYGINVDRVVLAGVSNTAPFSPVLSEQTGARVEDISTLSKMPVSGGRSDAAGAIGALL
jgi:type IV pilus assembly protein PilM